VVGVNDLVPAGNLANLVKCDPTRGKLTDTVMKRKIRPLATRWSRVVRGSKVSPCAKAPPRSRGRKSGSRSSSNAAYIVLQSLFLASPSTGRRQQWGHFVCRRIHPRRSRLQRRSRCVPAELYSPLHHGDFGLGCSSGGGCSYRQWCHETRILSSRPPLSAQHWHRGLLLPGQ
jgi:hypothetical protein